MLVISRLIGWSGGVGLLLVCACGGDTGQDRDRPGEGEAGASGAGVGGAGTGVAGAGQPGRGGAGASGAGAGQGNTGGADELCPEIFCDVYCPGGLWQDENGCDLCACAPPELTMPLPYGGAPPEYASLSGTAEESRGAVDRLTLDLVWRYDEERMEDEELTVRVTLVIEDPPRSYAVEQPVTYDVLEEPPLVRSARVEGGGPMDASEALTCVGGFVMLRQAGDRLLGGAMLEFSGIDIGVGEPVVAGSFDLPLP